MLRLIFVLTCVIVGAYYALQSPFYALLFYLGNAYFRPEVWVWSTSTIVALNLSLITGVYVCLAMILSGSRRAVDRTFLLVVFFLMHTLASTLLSEDFDYSWYYWKSFLKTVIILYVMVILVDDIYKLRMTMMVMVYSLIFEIKQGLVYLLLMQGVKNSNGHPVLGDDNGVALGMLMLVPVCVVLQQTTRHKWAQWLYRLLLISALYRGISSYSRGAFLACIAMGIVYWLRAAHKLRVLLAMIVITAIVVPTMPEQFWNRMQTIETYNETQEGSALGRLHFWAVAIKMAEAHPVFGIGYNGYTRVYDQYDFSKGRYGKKRAVHSSWLGTLAELGYVGALILALIIFVSFWNCHVVHKFAKQFHELSSLRLYAIALETSLVVWLVGGSFHIFQYNEFVWHYLTLTFVLRMLVRESYLSHTALSYHESLVKA